MAQTCIRKIPARESISGVLELSQELRSSVGRVAMDSGGIFGKAA